MKTPPNRARRFSLWTVTMWAGATVLLVAFILELPGRVAAGVCEVFLVALAVVTAVKSRRQERALKELRAVAESLQRVMQRRLPDRVGGLRMEARCVTAQSGVPVGGDVYDVVHTPFGVRLLMGDAMGKGLAAVETAMDTLVAFRELAGCEAWLPAMAQRMDAALARREGFEDFVTALLVTFPDDGSGAEFVCCGHPPPLLLRAGRATFVDALPPAPPLGLFDLLDGWCKTSGVSLTPGDRLLFYTDGVTEARDAAGGFYPLAERGAELHDEDPAVFLDALIDDLTCHSQGRLQDDAALLLVDCGEVRACEPKKLSEVDSRIQTLPPRRIR